MKKILILIITVLGFSPFAFSQYKAGKADTMRHSRFGPGCGTKHQLSIKEQMKTDTSKNYNCPIIVSVTKHDPSMCPQCGAKRNLSAKEEMKAEVMKAYTCPMHPDVPLDKNGICPKCKTSIEEKTI